MRSCLIVLLACLCIAAVPPRPRVKLESPKGKEFEQSLRRTPPQAPRVVVMPGLALVWTQPPDTNNPPSQVVWLVHSSTNFTMPVSNWTAVVVTTNWYPFTVKPVAEELFHVRASNTVTLMCSP